MRTANRLPSLISIFLVAACIFCLFSACGSGGNPETKAGERALKSGLLSKAETHLNKGLQQGDKQAARGLITIALKRGNSKRALLLLQKLPAATPLYRAFVLEKAGEPAQAGALYLAISRREPRNTQALYGAARWLIHTHNWKEARRILRQLYAINPESPSGKWAKKLLRALP